MTLEEMKADGQGSCNNDIELESCLEKIQKNFTTCKLGLKEICNESGYQHMDCTIVVFSMSGSQLKHDFGCAGMISVIEY